MVHHPRMALLTIVSAGDERQGKYPRTISRGWLGRSVLDPILERFTGFGSRGIFGECDFHVGRTVVEMGQGNVLIQGLRGAGKTHLVKRIIDRFGEDFRTGGFFTVKSGSVVRFRTWDNYELMDNGPSGILYDESDRIIRTSVFEELGVWAVERSMGGAGLMVFDELGRFELGCNRFTAAVHEALDQPTPLVATLKLERNPFLDSLRNRKDVFLFTIAPLNREQVYEEVVKQVSGALGLR
jgi:nucleoside-triphosphatase THEP1